MSSTITKYQFELSQRNARDFMHDLFSGPTPEPETDEEYKVRRKKERIEKCGHLHSKWDGYRKRLVEVPWFCHNYKECENCRRHKENKIKNELTGLIGHELVIMNGSEEDEFKKSRDLKKDDYRRIPLDTGEIAIIVEWRQDLNIGQYPDNPLLEGDLATLAKRTIEAPGKMSGNLHTHYDVFPDPNVNDDEEEKEEIRRPKLEVENVEVEQRVWRTMELPEGFKSKREWLMYVEAEVINRLEVPAEYGPTAETFKWIMEQLDSITFDIYLELDVKYDISIEKVLYNINAVKWGEYLDERHLKT